MMMLSRNLYCQLLKCKTEQVNKRESRNRKIPVCKSMLESESEMARKVLERKANKRSINLNE